MQIFHGPYVSNFQEIYEYLDSKKISEKIENYNRLAERLNRNLKSNNEQSKLQEDRFKEFSSKIFDNTIKEYEIFIK